MRDYKVASGGSDRLNTASPFNIKVRSLTMRDFNATEVEQLYQQHTLDTGQVFTAQATAMAFDLTQGQPRLVNALAFISRRRDGNRYKCSNYTRTYSTRQGSIDSTP